MESNSVCNHTQSHHCLILLMTRIITDWTGRQSVLSPLLIIQVSIQRPPTAAQHGVLTTSSRGPPPQAGIKPRPFSAKARITTERVGEKTNVGHRSRPPWRPFSGHAALNRPAPLMNKECDSSTVTMKEELSQDSTPVPSVYKDRLDFHVLREF